MIFVTVGTHEQPFNRLIEYIDNMKGKGLIKEEVIIQTGFSTYKPQYCKWSRLLPYKEMLENISKARIVITHGGPASFIMALQIGKTPIVVPRQYKFNEHVNDHQIEFTQYIAERRKNIIPVYEIENLEEIINNYNKIITNISHDIKSNNERFNMDLEREVNLLLRGSKI